MAIARCEKCGKPAGVKHNYVKSVEPIGYPNTASICGSGACENPGLIWLNEEELVAHENGASIFDLPTKAIKIKVKS